MTNKVDDEIVEETRLLRQAHAKSLGYDPKRIVADLQQEEKDSGECVIERPPRTPEARSKRSTA